jgi:hypothetical protein
MFVCDIGNPKKFNSQNIESPFCTIGWGWGKMLPSVLLVIMFVCECGDVLFSFSFLIIIVLKVLLT